MTDRYSRQALFPGIGKEGQQKLGQGFAVIIGCGALGSLIASALVRAGVGKVRIIDRDFIEYHNLHRQVLYDEDDVRNELPKAIAAERHLKKVNSSIEIEGIVADVNFTNIEKFVHGANVILDALDNMETRLLINDAALKLRIPWVYGGAVASHGMTMNIIPGETPCFRCIAANPGRRGLFLTCDTAGVISPAPWIVASLQAAEAMKILVGAKEVNRQLVVLDVWENTFHRLKVEARKDCPACQGKYESLGGKHRLRATSLCGQSAVQVLDPRVGNLALPDLAERLKEVGTVSYNDYILHFTVDSNEMLIFPDGRAIVKNTTNETLAKGLYAKYIGT
ncbi:MAG: ThiF family adenylyltransferase [Chloroflexi bacterium]|nr:ThiF family adenylyltransferase [Chloroflexota bacterium]